MARANERDRFKYGICTNRDKDGKPCPKCESKEVQKTRMGQDFVCEECKEPMRQVPPPKPPTNWLKIILPVVIVLLIGGGVAFMMTQKGDDKPEEKPEIPKEQPVEPVVVNKDTTEISTTVVPTDPVEVKTPEEPKKEPEKPKPQTSTTPDSKTLDLGYGIYKGEIRNGKAHGNGTLTYSKRTLIHDLKQLYAEPGDYATGQFREGRIVNVKWYNSNGDFKQTVMP